MKRECIWITRALNETELALAKSLALPIQVYPLIHTQAHSALQVQVRERAIRTQHWVFTSRNAVEATISLLGEEAFKGKTVWVVGESTATALPVDCLSYCSPVADGSHLAQFIMEHRPKGELVHFCGNRRRPELSILLKKSGFEVFEIEVYETIVMTPQIEDLDQFTWISLSSPSAVEGLLLLLSERHWRTKNFLAIGSTTLNALRDIGAQHVFVSSEQSTIGMLHTLAGHINQNTPTV